MLAAIATVVAWQVAPRAIPGVRLVSATLRASKPGIVTLPGAESLIEVTFTTATPLEQLRARSGMDFIAARLFACNAPRIRTQEPGAQTIEYFRDRGRVTLLGQRSGRYEYRAMMDATLTELVGNQFQSRNARMVGPLCFRLYGGRMWWGRAQSDTIRLPV